MKQQPKQNQLRTNDEISSLHLPKTSGLAKAFFCLLLSIGVINFSTGQIYRTTLSGAIEAPPNTSPGTGTVTVIINTMASTMRVQATFSGLIGNTTAAHIHAATPSAGTGIAGVATTTPTFTGFPNGITNGSYDNTFDMTLASSYNASYITNNGGTTASAFAALHQAIIDGKAYFNLHSAAFPGGELRGFLAPCSATFYAYNASNKHVVSFSASSPGTYLTDVALTGLSSDETLTGIDYRPADGFIYGMVTSNVTNMGRIVTINPMNGSLGSPGSATFSMPSNFFYGLDFNPVPDRFRLFRSGGTSGTRSQRYNPNNGAFVANDTDPFYAPGDVNENNSISVVHCAYTNSVAGTSTTTLFAVDYLSDLLVRIGGVGGTPSPNGGATTTIGSLGVNTSSQNGGFDIEPVSNAAYAVLRVGGVSGLYSVNLATGASTLIGSIGSNSPIINGLTIIPCAPTACVAPANRIYVDASAAPGGTGSSWACAVRELSAAVATANANPAITSIWVANGTYKPTTGTDRTATLSLTRSNLRIRGGFAGGEANEADANPVLNPTILSGEIGAAGPADNSFHLLIIYSLAASANGLVIDGISFENANAADFGGAMVAYSNNPTTLVRFSRCRFASNRATDNGGAIYLIVANLTLDRCMFANNTAGNAGGALYSYQSDVTVNGTVFANNTAMQGGAVYGNFGVPVYNRSVFTGNAAAFGGAVYQNRMNTMYNNCVFNANSSSVEGGAIYVHNQCVAGLNNTTLFNNTAMSNGGAVLLNFGGSVVAQNSIFWKNAVNGNMMAPGAVVHNATNGSNVYANCMLQANTSIPADNAMNIRNNMRGIDPEFINESSPRGADMLWSTADDGLQLASCNPQISIALPGCSPAINTGDNALVPGGDDLNNNPRTVCAIVDRGAYENQDCVQPNAPQREVEFTKLQTSSNSTGIVANPFSSDLQIRYIGTEKAGIAVFGLGGKAMWSKNNISEGINHADASNWARGMYQVVITTASGKRTNFKVVKM